MRTRLLTALMAAVLALTACGGSDEPQKEEKREVIKAEDTAFGTLVGAPRKVEESTDAAADQYRDSMNQRLEQDEGGSREEPAGD